MEVFSQVRWCIVLFEWQSSKLIHNQFILFNKFAQYTNQTQMFFIGCSHLLRPLLFTSYCYNQYSVHSAVLITHDWVLQSCIINLHIHDYIVTLLTNAPDDQIYSSHKIRDESLFMATIYLNIFTTCAFSNLIGRKVLINFQDLRQHCWLWFKSQL